MTKPRALDLFCGSGGATRGLQLAGFYVVGVDINKQKHYCGDEFYQGDALTFGFENCFPKFDFIWASPPCQKFTALRFMPDAKKDHPNLIPATRERLAASGIHYCIENVDAAPLGGNLIMLCGTMFGLRTADGRAELRRHRLFETSFSIPLRPQCHHNGITLGVYGGHIRDRCRRTAIGVNGNGTPQSGRRGRVREYFSIAQAREAMQIDWMPMSKLSQAIPPAYSQWIGEQALQILEAERAA
jgi:DNA (cytosine-5)-methyltransferase 1